MPYMSYHVLSFTNISTILSNVIIIPYYTLPSHIIPYYNYMCWAFISPSRNVSTDWCRLLPSVALDRSSNTSPILYFIKEQVLKIKYCI